MAIWAVARKEFRLLLRDRLSAVILLVLPLLFIFILKLLLDEDRLRVSVVDLDEGDYYELKPDDLPRTAVGTAGLLAPGGGPWQAAAGLFAEQERAFRRFPERPWSQVVLRDLRETAGIRVEMIGSLEEAERLTTEGRRAAVVVLGPDFSRRMSQCSFLKEGINPFYRDGVLLNQVGVKLLRDPTQQAAAAIIDQVTQVTLLRVILPYMIGEAFGKLSQPAFMSMLADRVPGGKFLPPGMKQQLGNGVQGALKDLFSKYDLTAKTWAALTKAQEPGSRDEPGGLSVPWAARYQILVPSSLVMFAFALVLPVGWLFVAERRQGTLKRLRASPVTRGEVLLGKFLPYFVLSLVQGVFLLVAGKLIFGMSWGPSSWSLWQQALTLLPVVAATALAAVGLAMLQAAVTRAEMQVALVGSLLVLLLGLLSGCLIPRELMPEAMVELSRATPHAWALDAYRQLLTRDDPSATLAPNLAIVTRSCLVLAGFGVGFLALAWGLLRLE